MSGGVDSVLEPAHARKGPARPEKIHVGGYERGAPCCLIQASETVKAARQGHRENLAAFLSISACLLVLSRSNSTTEPQQIWHLESMAKRKPWRREMTTQEQLASRDGQTASGAEKRPTSARDDARSTPNGDEKWPKVELQTKSMSR